MEFEGDKPSHSGNESQESDADRATQELVRFVGQVDLDTETGQDQSDAFLDIAQLVRRRSEVGVLTEQLGGVQLDLALAQSDADPKQGDPGEYRDAVGDYAVTMQSLVAEIPKVHAAVENQELLISEQRRVHSNGGRNPQSPYLQASLQVDGLLHHMVAHEAERGPNPYGAVLHVFTELDAALVAKRTQQIAKDKRG